MNNLIEIRLICDMRKVLPVNKKDKNKRFFLEYLKKNFFWKILENIFYNFVFFYLRAIKIFSVNININWKNSNIFVLLYLIYLIKTIIIILEAVIVLLTAKWSFNSFELKSILRIKFQYESSSNILIRTFEII